jgi:outer membrane usher protein FimD/PapC
MTYGTNNNGNYSGMTAAALHTLAGAIQVGPGAGNAYITPSGGVTILDNGAGFTVTATSSTGDTFAIGESANGTPTQSCTGTASPACQNGSW